MKLTSGNFSVGFKSVFYLFCNLQVKVVGKSRRLEKWIYGMGIISQIGFLRLSSYTKGSKGQITAVPKTNLFQQASSSFVHI